MKSIKSKIFLIVLIGIIASSVTVGAFGIFGANTVIRRDSADILDLMTQVQSSGLNTMFSDIEKSTIVLAGQVQEHLESLMVFHDFERYMRYKTKLEDISYYIASSTANAIAVYVRFAPEITDEVDSFVWKKTDDFFKPAKLTDFPIYDSDYSNSWYYKAQVTGRGVWTKPYYNDDFREYVITFAMPVYKNGKFFAVVGMDIDFDDIVAIVNSISVYDTGYAFLTDEAFVVTYHRSIRAGVRMFDKTTDFNMYYIDDLVIPIYEYTLDGKKFRMMYKPLENGMRLVVSVPSKEIDRERNRLFIEIVISILVISILLSLISMWVSKRLTLPLKELTDSTSQIIAGVYELNFNRKPHDEIGELMNTFLFMARSLKVQFNYINSLVYFDSMTGAKNKRAFLELRNKIDAAIESAKAQNEKYEFGVIVFDVNNLKEINDKYGHEAGDLLIKNSCDLIKKIFSESEIFRIGGDEFVIVITGLDFENRFELLTKFRTEMDYEFNNKTEVSEKLSIANGLAVYDALKDLDFQAVFDRADEEMYKTKISMKGGREFVR